MPFQGKGECGVKMSNTEKPRRTGWFFPALWGLWCALTLGTRIVVADIERAQEDLAVGMFDVEPVSLEGAPRLLTFFAKMRQNLPQDGWSWAVCALALAVVFYLLRKKADKIRPGIVVAGFSVVFGVVQVLSLSICKLDSWAFLSENNYQMCLALFCIVGYALLFYHAVWGLFYWLDVLGHWDNSLLNSPRSRVTELWQTYTGPISFAALGLAWLPWLVVCWPGSVDWDSHTQISQVIGDMAMTAHHTVLSTWLHGGAVWLGRLLGSDNLGVFLYVALQTLAAAWVFSRMVLFAKRLKLPLGVQAAILCFFALVPAWGAFMQTMVKDTLFAVLFALFMLRTAELLLFGASRVQIARYALVALLCCLLRQNGVYAVLPALVAVCFVAKGGSLRRGVALGTGAVLAVLLTFNTVTGALLAIPQGSRGEMLSIPFQQTARYVKYYENEVTPEERAAIDAVLDFEKIGSSYDPMMSDGVKGTYKNPDSAALAGYFKTWFSMFLKKPVIYLQALQGNTYGYYSVVDSGFAYEYYMFNNAKAMDWQCLEISYADSDGYARYMLYNLLLAFEHSPLGLFTSRGFNSLLLLALGFWLARRRFARAIPLFVGQGLLWLTCIASPVNDLLRYFLPILASLPVVFCVAIYAAGSKKADDLLKISK